MTTKIIKKNKKASKTSEQKRIEQLQNLVKGTSSTTQDPTIIRAKEELSILKGKENEGQLRQEAALKSQQAQLETIYQKLEAKEEERAATKPTYAEDLITQQTRPLTKEEEVFFQRSIDPTQTKEEPKQIGVKYFGYTKSGENILVGTKESTFQDTLKSSTGRTKKSIPIATQETLAQKSFMPQKEEKDNRSFGQKYGASLIETGFLSPLRGVGGSVLEVERKGAEFLGVYGVQKKVSNSTLGRVTGLYGLQEIQEKRPYSKTVKEDLLGVGVIGGLSLAPALILPASVTASYFTGKEYRKTKSPESLAGLTLSVLPIASKGAKVPKSYIRYGEFETGLIKNIDYTFKFSGKTESIFVPYQATESGKLLPISSFAGKQLSTVEFLKKPQGFDVPIILGEKITGKQRYFIKPEGLGNIKKGTIKIERQTQLYGKEYNPYLGIEERYTPYQPNMFEKAKIKIAQGEQTTLKEFGIKNYLSGYEPFFASMQESKIGVSSTQLRFRNIELFEQQKGKEILFKGKKGQQDLLFKSELIQDSRYIGKVKQSRYSELIPELEVKPKKMKGFNTLLFFQPTKQSSFLGQRLIQPTKQSSFLGQRLIQPRSRENNMFSNINLFKENKYKTFYSPKFNLKPSKNKGFGIKLSSRQYKYTPSVTAQVFNIRSKSINLFKARSGISIRPIRG